MQQQSEKQSYMVGNTRKGIENITVNLYER